MPNDQVSQSHGQPTQASAAVPEALGVFLRELIDYAGLFPPAELSLDDAITAYAAYRNTEDAWMLGDFIIPARRLEELGPYTDLFTHEAPFHFSAIATGGRDASAFLTELERDLARVEAFEAEHGRRGRVVAMEAKLPAPVVEGGHSAVAAFVERVAGAIDRAPVELHRLSLEPGFGGAWRQQIPAVVSGLAAAPAHAPTMGLKIRCGGLEPTAFPTPEQVAFAIASTREAGLSFKATAGLHHPLRHMNRRLDVMEHGFLNVFGAGVLAHALELSEPALRQILRSENAGAFVFTDDDFGFQDLRISVAQLEAARLHFATSFGSCSFDEPREDLRALGLL